MCERAKTLILELLNKIRKLKAMIKELKERLREKEKDREGEINMKRVVEKIGQMSF